jgi:hypothetical protein
VPEASLDGLVKSGVIPKPSGGKYELIGSVQAYISHLRNANAPLKDQTSLARHLDMSDRNLRDVLRGLGIGWPVESVDDVRVSYIRDLREKAAGRGGDDQAELARARTRDAIASAKMREVQYFESIGKLVSVEEIEPRLESWATVARSEVHNALNKIIADIEGENEVTINREMVDGYMLSAFAAIGEHPGRAAPGGLPDTGDAAH